MPLFAHTETGHALDVWPNDTEAEYLARFPAASGWSVVQVPDGTVHGACGDGDGTFTNPSSPSVPTNSPVIEVTAFKKRFTLSERASIMGSADNVVKAFLDELNTAASVDLSDADTIAGVDYLEQQTLIASGRAAQILTP